VGVVEIRPRQLVGAEVHPADVQDRDGASLVIAAIHRLFPWLRRLLPTASTRAQTLREALAKFGNWIIEIVRMPAEVPFLSLQPDVSTALRQTS
jgi:hypothetical protein